MSIGIKGVGLSLNTVEVLRDKITIEQPVDEIVFTGLDDGFNHKIIFSDIKITNNYHVLSCRMSQDSGNSYLITGYWGGMHGANGAELTASQLINKDKIYLSAIGSSQATIHKSYGLSGIVYLYNPSANNIIKSITANICYYSYIGNFCNYSWFYQVRNFLPYNTISFTFNDIIIAGNITHCKE